MNLKDLVQWAMRLDFGKPTRTINDPGVKVERLWVNGPLQVERVTVEPNFEIVTHRHPNVDSWEYRLAGSGTVMIGKHKFVLGPDSPNLPLPVKRGVWHAGETGDNGASFLSIQEWFIDVGTIGDDWEANDYSFKAKKSDQLRRQGH